MGDEVPFPSYLKPAVIMLNHNSHDAKGAMAGRPTWRDRPCPSAHLCSGLLTPVLGTPGGPSSPRLRGGSSPGSWGPGECLALRAPIQERPDIDATQRGMGSSKRCYVTRGWRGSAHRSRTGPGKAQRGGRAREGCE